MSFTHTTQRGALSVSGAIIVAGVIIALAVLATGREAAPGANPGSLAFPQQAQHGGSMAGTAPFREITDEDYVRGNPDAAVTIVEFSDFECPWCGRFHPTLQQIIDERPNDVNWVYRHFPITTIHSRAAGAAVASECIGELAGNDAFWTFTDNIFAGGTLSDTYYTEQAASFGIEADAFQACVSNPDSLAKVQTDLEEAVTQGGRGTPFNVMITASGNIQTFSGALPIEQIHALVDQGLTS